MRNDLPDIWRELDRPFGSWRPLLRQLDDLFAEASQLKPLDAPRAMPIACDVDEGDDHFLLSFDMPGVDKKDIDIEVKDQRLVVRGERRDERKDKNGYVERRFGSFERSVTLPAGIKAEQVEASFENGVLKVAVPKVAETKAHKVEIGAGGGLLKRLFGGAKESGKESIQVKADGKNAEQPSPH